MASASAPLLKPQQFKYFCVLDFEATCDDSRDFNTQEVIEFPIILVNASTGAIVAEFHHYIKPVVEPRLTKFCRDLTGITQDQVDNGIAFADAFAQVEPFLREHVNFSDEGPFPFIFVTCGDWDLKTMLPMQCTVSNLTIPPYMRSWVNLKKVFAKFYKKRPHGMLEMLRHFNLPLVGRHHSGIDDTRNIAAVLIRMLQDGCITPTT